jgi:hypothetical protein
VTFFIVKRVYSRATISIECKRLQITFYTKPDVVKLQIKNRLSALRTEMLRHEYTMFTNYEMCQYQFEFGLRKSDMIKMCSSSDTKLRDGLIEIIDDTVVLYADH